MSENRPPRAGHVRKFMVVVDDTPECRVALRFAARRAEHTQGGLVMLRVLEPGDFQHWMSVEDLMREEAREEAESLLRTLASEVQALTGMMPEFVIREGKTREELLAQIAEDPAIAVLVLGAGDSKEGPGPLVSALAGQMSGTLPVPVTVVPGTLSREEIDAIA
ncbi:universal stress protein [Futiania mangrovi]|uniref:Universal stress protein n=1 Tax=Futiania mangrovi TaxID=2959716 RepID=A0A9J6PF46_9PROT|nr:universal stress protein [Futiania mangrovii]MCP1336411.1 universal stress protein [Futiania mangrovii]